MKKDFDSWNKEKKNLEDIGHSELAFHEREIWWASLGINLEDLSGKSHHINIL